MEKELTPKQQTSEAIRQSETILIMTAQRPTIDQVASTLALTQILRKFGKKVTAVISDDVHAGAKFLPTNLLDRQLGGLRDFIVHVDTARAEVDTIRYDQDGAKLNVHITPYQGGFSQRDVSFSYGDYHYDLVIILGVASHGRIDRAYAQDAEKLAQTPLVNIDFHRSNEQYGAINLIEPSAASLAEILIALSESLQAGLIDGDIATTMLAGIVAATDRFTAPHTTAKTLTVAAQMMAGGGDHAKVIKGLYKSGDRSDGRSDTRSDARQSDRSKQPSQPQSARVERSEQSAPRPRQEVSVEPVSLRQPPEQSASPKATASMSEESSTPEAPEAVLTEESVAFTLPAPAPSSLERPRLHSQTPTQHVPELKSVLAPPLQAAVEPPYDDEIDESELVPQRKTPSALESLLPPQHIEPEPLLNGPETPRTAAQPVKAPNPINNPNFFQNVDKKRGR